jgi:aspartyl-tRNA(Asn)/glutamyl-tRNA(Gln) amidotransferase subunit A
MTADFAFATISDLGHKIRRGETTPTELAEYFLERLDTIGRRLNAVVTLTPELALAQAKTAEEELRIGVDRGPLHGIPYGAKDLLATAGIPTSWGAAPFRDQVFDEDATVIRKLREAGAVLVAKLSMVELAGGARYEQPNASLTGPGRSAWNENHWSGGSSSGSGSAVGAGCVPFAIGTETWGSIHVPSTFNGLTGLRPTYGRVSRAGAMALSWTMDKIGPMAHTVDDCWTVLHAIAGPDPADVTTVAREMRPPHSVTELGGGWIGYAPGEPVDPNQRFRFAMSKHVTQGSQPEVAAAFEAALEVLRDFATIDEIDLPDLPWEAAATTVVFAEGASAFEDFVLDGGSRGLTAPEDRYGLYEALTIPAVDYIRALRIRRIGSRQIDAILSDYDALLAPTVPFVAPPIESRFAEWWAKDAGPTLGAIGNLCGLPSISVPNGFGERGLPTAMEFLGRAYNEGRIAAAARAYQARTDWHRQHPGW